MLMFIICPYFILFFTWLVFLCSSRLTMLNKPRLLATVSKAGCGFDCNRGEEQG